MRSSPSSSMSLARLFLLALGTVGVACAAVREPAAPETSAAGAPGAPQPGYAQPGYPQQAAPFGTAQPMVTSDAPMTLEEAEADLQKLEKSFSDPSIKLSAGPDACANACKALSSMKRAADRICELTAPAIDRCTSVRERVKNVETRVIAECPVCP